MIWSSFIKVTATAYETLEMFLPRSYVTEIGWTDMIRESVALE